MKLHDLIRNWAHFATVVTTTTSIKHLTLVELAYIVNTNT